MIRCLDIHTHHPAPQPLAVVSASPEGFEPLENQLYSVGIHPWLISRNLSTPEWEIFEKSVSLPSVVAIGECGVDKLKGGPMFLQLIIFKKQIDLSEKLGKPLIIHDVKAHNMIVGYKREYKPKQNWVVHGFRGKPTVAKMLTDEGIYLSFGENFNPESLRSVPKNMILAETDESSLSIKEIIENLYNSLYPQSQESQTSHTTLEDFTSLIEVNTNRFLFGNNEI